MGTHPIFESDFDCLTEMSDDRSCQVYIGYLPNDARMEDVEDFFKGYGKVKSVNLKPGYGFVDFEDIRDAEDAVRDLDGKRMCGEKVDIQHAKGPGHKARDRRDSGRPIVRDARRAEKRSRSRDRRRRSDSGDRRSHYRSHSRRSRTPPRRYSPPRGAYIVEVSNISTKCRWQDLKDEIRAQTKIECSFCEIHTPRDREGIVCFNRKDEMKDVLKRMDGFELKGRKLELRPRNKLSESRSRSRSRSRSGSASPKKRSRSRSRSRSPSTKRSRRSSSRSSKPKTSDDRDSDRTSDKTKESSAKKSPEFKSEEDGLGDKCNDDEGKVTEGTGKANEVNGNLKEDKSPDVKEDVVSDKNSPEKIKESENQSKEDSAFKEETAVNKITSDQNGDQNE